VFWGCGLRRTSRRPYGKRRQFRSSGRRRVSGSTPLWSSTIRLANSPAGPLGDRSLPRKSPGYIRVTEKPTSPKSLRGGAISPKAPRPQTQNAAEITLPQTRTARRSVPTSEVPGRHPCKGISAGVIETSLRFACPEFSRDPDACRVSNPIPNFRKSGRLC
jgi:hypothetical protein